MSESEKKEESLEEGFAQIEEMLAKMEESDVSLEDAFFLYEKGMKKLKECNDKIDSVEKKLLVLNGQGELEEF